MRTPSPPPDGRCKVFTANGGGITWKTPPVELLDKARAHHTATSYGNYYYSGRVRVMGFGQDCANETCTELVMEVPHLSLTACNAINKKLGIDTNNPSQWATAAPMGATAVNHGYQNQHRFLGVYSFSDSGSTSSYGDDEGFIKGLGAACVNRAGAAVADNPYVFFKVLLSR